MLRGVVLAPVVVALISCGGGDDEPERHEVPGLITFNIPASSPFSTTSATVTVRGYGNTNIRSVSWSNSAGGTGAATLTNETCVAFVFVIPCIKWEASIPLTFGTNVITVSGETSDNGFGQATTTITRT